MSRASFWWKQIIQLFPVSPKTKFHSRLLHSLTRLRWKKSSSWLIGVVAIVAMLLWNWKLFLATFAGISLMLLVYLMQGWNWQKYLSAWEKFFTGSNRHLTLAVGSGSIGALSTYMAATIWADSENRWLATGSIFQGLASVFTLILLIWHIFTDRTKRDETKFEQLLTDLSAVEPLKRLIAVRQLTRLANNNKSSQKDRDRLAEYFLLMLSSEQEPIVREALLETLQAWNILLKIKNNSPIYSEKSKPLQIPISVKVHT